jgi:hypothetical protein
MRSFDDPAASFEAWIFLALNFFCPTRFYVGLIVSTLKKFPDSFGVVAFVEAHVLATSRWLRTMDRDAVESGF